MYQFPNHVCEVCGTRKRKQGNWFLVTQDRRGDVLRILYWSEGVAQRKNVWACCSPQHVQMFVERWLAPEGSDLTVQLPGGPDMLGMNAELEQHLRTALTAEAQISQEAFTNGFAFEEKSTESILNAVEDLLEGYGADLEDDGEDSEDPVQFDA
jgi:hypothetical protein